MYILINSNNKIILNLNIIKGSDVESSYRMKSISLFSICFGIACHLKLISLMLVTYKTKNIYFANSDIIIILKSF